MLKRLELINKEIAGSWKLDRALMSDARLIVDYLESYKNVSPPKRYSIEFGDKCVILKDETDRLPWVGFTVEEIKQLVKEDTYGSYADLILAALKKAPLDSELVHDSIVVRKEA